MTTYDYENVLVWDAFGGVVHLLRNGTVTATDADTGQVPASLKQGGVTVTSLRADSSGRLTFQVDLPKIRLTSPNGLSVVVVAPQAVIDAVGAAVSSDAAVAGFVNNPASATRVAGDAIYPKRSNLPVNVKDYGAVGDGTADDTAAIQAAVNAGDTFFPAGTYKTTSTITIPTGREIRGAGAKSATITTAVDTPMFAWAGGEGQAIRNIRLQSTLTGAHTTFLIDVANPTRPVFQYVEISFPTASTMAGIRFRRDAGQPGTNSFMPSFDGLWLRNGRLVTDNVTDGFMANSWVWANAVGAPAAIEMSNISDGWTFSNVQVVPCDGTGAGYLFTNTNHIKIVGGYMDGSYDGISTGYGIKAVSSGRILISGYNFFNCGRSPIRFDSTHACVVTATDFYRNNKSDGSYPDIDLYSSTGNIFIGNTHSQPRNQTNKGAMYREDAASTKNIFDNNVLDTVLGNFYGTPVVQANANTRGPNCKPGSLFTRLDWAADTITPPAALLSIPAPAAWPTANMAIAHRFTLSEGAVYTNAQFRVDSGSGNMQAAVIKMSSPGALTWTRVMSSGNVACTTGDKTLSMGATYLEPGQYALVLWCDNVTATFRYISNSGLSASRLTAEWTDAAGVGASGTLSWASTRYVGGLTLTN